MFAIDRKPRAPDGHAPAPKRAPRSLAKAPPINALALQLATSSVALSSFSGNTAPAPGLQRKAVLGSPGDPYEREADAVADEVVRAREPASSELAGARRLSGSSSGQGGGAQRVSRAPASPPARAPSPRAHAPEVRAPEPQAAGARAPEAPPIVHEVLRSQGQPLEPATRAFMEPRFGQDFSGVRVHTSAKAAASAEAVDAAAYTAGQNVVFGAGRYAPGTAGGDRLLAHELAHTVQQAGSDRTGESGGPGAPPTIQRAMKFELQTRNYVWSVDKKGTKVDRLPRKYGESPDSESGENNFLTTGVKGDPAVNVGDFVKAKGIDKSKPAEHVRTYQVIDQDAGTVKLLKEEKTKGDVNPGTYELRYVDAGGQPLDVHQDSRGNFKDGPGKLVKKATKAEAKEGTAIELQSEHRGFLEFETPKWFRKWSALRDRIQEAVDMTGAMSGAPLVTDEATKEAVRKKVEKLKADEDDPRKPDLGELHEWPSELKLAKLPIVKAGGRLLVEIVDPTWIADIQSSESIAITQFESLLHEHDPNFEAKTVSLADDVVKDAAEATKKPADDLANLRGFLQLIFYYIQRGQLTDIRSTNKDGSKGAPGPAKFAFGLMDRTSFSSIFSTILSDKEREVFKYIVDKQLIVKELMDKYESLDVKPTSKFFKYGHGGSKSLGPTIDQWLKSIADPAKFGQRIKDKKKKPVNRDLLSPPVSGSAAMGASDVETEVGDKETNLVRFEVRGTSAHMGGRSQPASKWVAYAEEVFKTAAEKRKRTGPDGAPDDTSLIYDPPAADTSTGKSASTPKWEWGVKPELELNEPLKLGIDFEFRRDFPKLLGGRLQPFVYAGVGTTGLSFGGGATVDPIAGMGLFLAGKGGLRTDWFQSLQVSGGAEAGWAFDKNRFVRLGVGWEVWQDLGPDQQRSHLLYLFAGSRF